jgi:hypothetical protein
MHVFQKNFVAVFGLGLGVVVGGVGCAGSQSAILPGVPVHPLIAETLRLQGTATRMATSPSCNAAAGDAKPANVLELDDDTRVTIMLEAPRGEPALPLSMLRVTHLATNKTWCALTRADGTPAAIGGELPSGKYAVSVGESASAAPRKYEVKILRL